MPQRSFGSRLSRDFYTAAPLGKKSRITLSAPQLSLLGFAVLIALGAVLLFLPISRTNFSWSGSLTALFNATSAVCVTGLTPVDVASYYTPVGQLLLLLLIQIGGLGYMTLYSLMLLAVGRRLSLRDRLAMQQVLDLPGPGGVVRFVFQIARMTLVIEAIGVALLACIWVPRLGWGQGLYLSLFHSVSAFNNAGFSLFASHLTHADSAPLAAVVLSALVMLGSLGYPVLAETRQQLRERGLKIRWRAFSLHSRVSLMATGVLILLGAVGYLLIELQRPDTLGALSWGQKIPASLLLSIMRTAGFSALDIPLLSQASLFLTLSLMLVGANPGGTGGGLKTTTLVVMLNDVFHTFRGNPDNTLWGRRISATTTRKAWATLLLSVLWINAALLLLILLEPRQPLMPLLFEVVSAFSTTGLSVITPQLGAWGQFLLVLTMYVGRVGVITLGMAIWSTRHRKGIQYPEESLLVS